MTAHALIFDSGVGGFSVAGEIHHRLPGLSLTYLMDNALFPYGVQPDHALIGRITELCCRAVKEYEADILIIACNTASTIALPALRNALDIPVVGVVPAIKTAAEKSRSRCIGLLATPATVSRSYVDQLHSDHAADARLVRIGSRELVELCERYWITGEADEEQLKNILEPLGEHPELDHLVLGCTHFPLISPLLTNMLPGITLVDSGEAIARRVDFLLSGSHSHTENTVFRMLTTAPYPDAGDLMTAVRRIADFTDPVVLQLQ